jgi:hypothetical protein
VLKSIPQILRERLQLPVGFSIADLVASIRTLPVKIDDFEVLDKVPSNELSSLTRMAMRQNGEPFLKWWHYFDIYSRELDSLVSHPEKSGLRRPLRVLEIGVWRGGSLGLWREYFGSDAVIYGVDIDPNSSLYNGTHAQVRIGSQTDCAFMNSVIDEMSGVDVVIDDGSHNSRDVIETLRCLWPRLTFGGLYFIEDLHTSYWPAWGGGLHRRTSSIEKLKSLVDVLHQPYFERQADPFKLGITQQELFSVSFFDSVTVLSKRDNLEPRPFRGGRK